MRRLPVELVLLGAALAACVPTPAPAPAATADARAELRDLIADVTAATAHRYRVTDDRGRWMDTLKPIEIREASTFAAVYHTWSDADAAFHVNLATSDDLLSWTWKVELATLASQPTIAAAVGGGYVVAWEQEPDPIHIVVAYFRSWQALQGGSPDRRFDVPVTMRACGEGTPSIDEATTDRVALSFHYHGSCERDLQASGATDWSTWSAREERARDLALIELGVEGHIGDRDRLSFHGRDLMLLEGQIVPEDFGSQRIFLVDPQANHALQLMFRTDAGSVAAGNPTIGLMDVGGQPAIVVTLYLFAEGARGEEDGPLLFYRTLSDQPSL